MHSSVVVHKEERSSSACSCITCKQCCKLCIVGVWRQCFHFYKGASAGEETTTIEPILHLQDRRRFHESVTSTKMSTTITWMRTKMKKMNSRHFSQHSHISIALRQGCFKKTQNHKRTKRKTNTPQTRHFYRSSQQHISTSCLFTTLPTR